MPETKHYYVYILASRLGGTLYTGVTNNLVRRVWEHKNDVADGFTKRYKVHTLVWYELHENIEAAILREKRVKKWKRHYRVNLIEEQNPDWQDLWNSINK